MKSDSSSSIRKQIGGEIIFRPPSPSDAPAIIAYLNEIAGETDFLSFGQGEFTKTIEEEEQIIKDYLKLENHFYLLAIVNEEIAGIITANASQKQRLKHMAEFGISVRQKYWGQGIGRKLMEHMISWAQSNKVVKKLILYTTHTNHKAITLYEKLEFEREGLIKNGICIRGEFYDTLIMSRWFD